MMVVQGSFAIPESFAQEEGICAPQNYKNIVKNAGAIFSGTVISKEPLVNQYQYNVHFKINESLFGDYENFVNVTTSERRMVGSEPVGGDPFEIEEKYLVFAIPFNNSTLYAGSSGCNNSLVIPFESGFYGRGSHCSASVHLECLDRCGLYGKPNTPEPTCLSLCYNRNSDQCQLEPEPIAEFEEVTHETPLPDTFQVLDRRNTGLMEYNIPYDLSSGTIKDVNVICNGAEVYLLLDNSDETQLTITIPIKMINSFRDDFIDIFVVVNNHETEFEIISINSDNLTLQFDIPFVKAETYVFFDGSARTSSWVKENCQYDRLLVMEKPPKLQIREGVPVERITCYGDLKLIFKVTDNSPACVKPLTVQKLLVRGWTILGNP